MTKYNDHLSGYITNLYAAQDKALQRVREDTPKRGLPAISITPEEGRFLQFLVRVCSAEKALEIGTLGGYSGIWIARGLAPGGRLITLEKYPHHADVAREHFAVAGLSDQVEIRTGDARNILDDLIEEGPFDFVFIDADKVGYQAYFSWALENIRVGGVIAAHNAFRAFSLTGEPSNDRRSQAMDTYNRRVATEPRVISTIFPAGDGISVAVKTE